MDVFDRPLFQNRAARDRLKDMGNVQGFAPGGEVIQRFIPGDPVSFDLTGAIRRPVRAEVSSVGPRPSVRPSGLEGATFSSDILGLPSLTEAFQTGIPMSPGMIFDNLVVRAGSTINDPGTVMQALNEKLTDPNLRPNERRALENQRSALNFAIEAGYGATDAVTDALSVLQSVGSGVMEYGVAPVASAASPELGEMIYDQIPMFDATAEELAQMGQAVPSNLRPSDIPKKVAFEAAGRGTPPSAPSVGLPEPRTGLITPKDRQGPMAYTSPAELAAEKPAGPRTGPGTPGDRQAPLANAGLISDPTAVAAGLNSPEAEVRDKTIADFMQEFTSAAPKYEGTDKGLLLAQIGFAIAAGESPNAMQNIANGLLAGSDMLLKDKAAKAEFDRQLQLNALQYGLEGAANEREKGKPALQFIATKDMTWKGRPVKEGSPVYLSYKDIADAGGVVPDGLVDAATSAALIEKTQGVTKAYQDAYDRGVIDDTELRLATEGYADQASRVAKSQRALDYFEKTLFKLGEEGNLTGIEGSFQKLVGKLGNAAGFTAKDLDVLAKSGDAAEMEELLYRGVINTVPAVVEGQSANSISDTDVRLAMKGLVDLAISQGSFSSLFTSEEKVMRQIQDSMNMIAGNRQRAFAEMSAIEARLANRYTKAGDFYNPAYATDVLRPLREASGLTEQPDMVSTYGDMVLGENGTYKLILPGG